MQGRRWFRRSGKGFLGTKVMETPATRMKVDSSTPGTGSSPFGVCGAVWIIGFIIGLIVL